MRRSCAGAVRAQERGNYELMGVPEPVTLFPQLSEMSENTAMSVVFN